MLWGAWLESPNFRLWFLRRRNVQRLETLSASRAAPVREVERARMLLQYHAGNNPSAIQRALNISRVTIYHCLHKALEMGVEAGLKDRFHRPKEPVIGQMPTKLGSCIWLARNPKNLGYAAELWTRQALAAHVRQHAAAAGHPSSGSGRQSHRAKDSRPNSICSRIK